MVAIAIRVKPEKRWERGQTLGLGGKKVGVKYPIRAGIDGRLTRQGLKSTFSS